MDQGGYIITNVVKDLCTVASIFITIEPLRFLTVSNRLFIIYTGDNTHLYTNPKLASRGITLLQDILLKKKGMVSLT